MNIENIEKVKESNYIIKIGDVFMGIKNTNENYDFLKNKGSIDIRIADNENLYFDIKLGSKWIFMFSQLIEIYNFEELIEEKYVKKWLFNCDGIKYAIRFVYKEPKKLLVWIKNNNTGQEIDIVFHKTKFFELISKIVNAARNVNNFKFSINNENDIKRKLNIRKIDKKSGTIINSFNGIDVGEPHLSESDKFQIKYSALNRILYGRWLSVHAERINISVHGIITTIDEEYVLDTNEQNKSCFVALALLSSLAFLKV